MKLTRILCLMLALLMIAASAVACQKDNSGDWDDIPVDDTPSGGDTPAGDASELELVNYGDSKYVIVRDYKASPEVLNAVNMIVKAYENYLGSIIEVRECFSDRPDEGGEVGKKEILIGRTDRPESAKAFAGMKANDYCISIQGEKLVIGGPSATATAKAVAEFLNSVIYEQGNKYEVKGGAKLSCVFTKEFCLKRTATYSYSSSFACDARIDSYVLIYAKAGKMSDTYNEFAKELQGYILKETGYELGVYKDTRCWGDFEILIGETIRTGNEISLADNEYHISLKKTTVTYEDGSKHEGATLQILFGKDAYDAALEAFKKQAIPTSKTPIELALPDGLVITNKT